ncbi:hypothetical protein LEMLEM_LOCUS20455 [Lemmus lemmus]
MLSHGGLPRKVKAWGTRAANFDPCAAQTSPTAPEVTRVGRTSAFERAPPTGSAHSQFRQSRGPIDRSGFPGKVNRTPMCAAGPEAGDQSRTSDSSSGGSEGPAWRVERDADSRAEAARGDAGREDPARERLGARVREGGGAGVAADSAEWSSLQPEVFTVLSGADCSQRSSPCSVEQTAARGFHRAQWSSLQPEVFTVLSGAVCSQRSSPCSVEQSAARGLHCAQWSSLQPEVFTVHSGADCSQRSSPCSVEQSAAGPFSVFE